MSYDTQMLLRTSLSAAEVSATLVHDPALGDLALIETVDASRWGATR